MLVQLHGRVEFLERRFYESSEGEAEDGEVGRSGVPEAGEGPLRGGLVAGSGPGGGSKAVGVEEQAGSAGSEEV